MYQYKSHLGFHWINVQRHIRLKKHQQMIDRTLRWQQHALPAESRQTLAAITKLRPALATILTIFVK